MSTWGEILTELKQEMEERGMKPPFDAVRRKYMAAAYKKTGRNTILYATKWTQAGDIDPEVISITDEDVCQTTAKDFNPTRFYGGVHMFEHSCNSRHSLPFVNAQHRRNHRLMLILSRINEWHESSKSMEITGFLDSATFSLFRSVRSWQGRLNHREHRGSQRVVIFIFRPLCVTLCPLWFSETLFRKYQKVSGVLVTATRDTKDPISLRLNRLLKFRNDFFRVNTIRIASGENADR